MGHLPIGSVVIPAHNEAAVIIRCLGALLAGFRPGELEVVVACNGCTDGTAGIVRSGGYPVRVVEIAAASKAAALRAGEAAVTAFPRLYLDADVVLPSVSARCVLDCLRSGPVPAARPPISYDAREAVPIVRSYYRARSEVPAVLGSLWGAGVYGLSAAGRSRFGPFPDLTSDDLFVDQHFQRAEIAVVDAPPVVVSTPRRTGDLLRILRRTYHGNAENRRARAGAVEMAPVTTRSTLRDLARLSRTGPVRLVDVGAYVLLTVLARGSLAVVPPVRWARDDSSRVPPVEE